MHMLEVIDDFVPAHDPYFLRFILDIPKVVRKKAQKSPARAFRAFNVNQDSQKTPTTATTYLCVMHHRQQRKEDGLETVV